MTLFHGNMLTGIRKVLDASLTETATVQRVTRTGDGMGGFSESWATVATVSARVAPLGNSPQERVIAERLTGVTLWTVTLPAGTDVTDADRIGISGRTFEVTGMLGPQSLEAARRAVCKEVS